MINPADPRRLRSLGWSPKSRSDSESYAAIDWRVMPSVVTELGRTDDVAASCALFIIATAVRAKTARLAKWSDIDLEARTWTPPLADLKDGKHHKRPFIVPLNDVAIDALERVRASSSRYVFANSAGGPIGDGAHQSHSPSSPASCRLARSGQRGALHRPWISRVFSHLGRRQAPRRRRSRRVALATRSMARSRPGTFAPAWSKSVARCSMSGRAISAARLPRSSIFKC